MSRVCNRLAAKWSRTIGCIPLLSSGALLLAMFFLFPLHFSLSSGTEDAIKVTFIGGQRRDTYIRSFQQRNVQFISLKDFADLLGARTYFNSRSKKMVLYLPGRSGPAHLSGQGPGAMKRVKVTAFNPFVAVDDDIFQLPVDTEFMDGDIFIPIRYFLELIQGILPFQVVYDEDDSILKIDFESVNITAVDIEEKVNGTLIKIFTTKQFDPSSISTRISQGWLYIDVYGGRLDSIKISLTQPKGMIRRIVPIQLEKLAQLSFKLAREIDPDNVYLSESSDAILVSLRTKADIPKRILQALEEEKKKWMIDKIIIDPGHGGKDPGAIGPTGLYEKTVVLDVAKRLKKLLQRKLGVEVLMTRESDKFVPLQDRSSLANKVGGKLFISIHTNSNRRSRIGGFSAYFLGPAKTEEALEVAQRENRVINYEDSPNVYGDISDENYILLAMAQNAFNKESQDLAAIVQEELERGLGIEDRGVRQAGFYVLIGASMPNILVEVAHISNRREERLLKSGSYRQKIAEALFESIKKFKAKYEKGIS